jgi:membrane protein implicated in regulation of membrane protease activity
MWFAALAGFVALIVTVANGKYGGTVVALVIIVLALLSARRHSRREGSGPRGL